MKNTNKYLGNELQYISRVLNSEKWSSTEGSWTGKLEREFAKKFDSKYGVAFNSGTSTMHAALLALGVKPGDEVISPAHTVIMNSFVTLHQNALNVYADIDPDTFNMCPDDLERKITDKTKAIQVVHMHGNPSDMERIMEIANHYKIPVIEDSAQCVLSTINGQLVGTFGDMASWSFENKKHISAGEGGMVTTDNKEYATIIRKTGGLGYKTLSAGQSLRQLLPKDFQNPHYKRHDILGYNYRMNEITAALALGQLERAEFLVNRRCEVAKMYNEAFKDCDYIIPQKVLPGHTNTYWTYTVRYERDDWFDLYDEVKAAGGDGFYGGLSVPYHEPIMSNYNYRKGDCPNAESVQPKMMQFKTNYRDLLVARKKINILSNIIKKRK